MSLDQRKPVEAKRIGNTLVAAFHRATPPLVWRFDLERNHSFTLALQGDDGEWELGLTSPKGEFHPVAHFAIREDAEEAFVKVERMLSKNTKPWFKLTIRSVVLAILLMILLFIIVFIHDFIANKNGHSSYGGMQLPSVSSASPPEIKPVVPLSADDFLKPPQ